MHPEKTKIIKAIGNFFASVSEEEAKKDYPKISSNYAYTKDIFFSKFIRNPDDDWWYDIIIKNLSPCLDKIMSKYGSEKGEDDFSV